MSTTSAYTPPLQDNMNKRHSRSRTRDNLKRRRYDKSRSERTSHIKKQNSSRSRLRYYKSTDSSTDSRDEHYSKTKQHKRQSRQYRRSCIESSSTTNSTSNIDSDSHNNKSNLRSRRRRRYRRTSSSSSNSTLSYKRSTRNYLKDHGDKRNTETPRKRYRSRSRSLYNNTFFRKFARLIDNNKRNTFEGAHNVIPEFDPDANSQTAADWIRKVNETANIYEWNEKQIIYYAIPKLCGYARKWYQGQSTLDLSWRQWQRKIIKTFPDDRNYADRLYEMLERKSKREESLEEYFHDKMRLVKMCGINGRNAVDCIVHGVFDSNIRLNAQGSSFRKPSQLLRYLRRISKKTAGNIRKILPENKYTVQNNKESNIYRPSASNRPTSFVSRNRLKLVRCYNCSDVGHTAQSCSKPIKRCDKCSRLGHESHECQQENRNQANNAKYSPELKNDVKKVLQITKDDKVNKKYFKTIKLNDTLRSAYVDFGSQCTLIKEKIASESSLILDKSGLPVIRGFALGCVLPFGRVQVSIEIDAVKANVDAYVVPDYLLNTDVLIGQSLTELPTVTALKTSSKLTLYCDDSKTDRINLYNSKDLGDRA
ncbi:uncharacterized protein LOC123654898 [Melitaea cinxia]|uniref:uncharacterized protein LOC123654898 n=1 Tax=Melitaea cinxia TaxID=113334 RepID=UPI001E26FE7F|nr:uncharacterized protein LOC123654898 [Melitaea cinxia]